MCESFGKQVTKQDKVTTFFQEACSGESYPGSRESMIELSVIRFGIAGRDNSLPFTQKTKEGINPLPASEPEIPNSTSIQVANQVDLFISYFLWSHPS